MTYPRLVREKDCKTDIHVVLYKEGVSQYGAPVIAVDKDFKCNYQDKAKRVLTNEKVLIELTGLALFCKDIAPELPVITSGEITIFGEKRSIYQGTKARNPDGTVNYVALEIM